MRLNQIKEIIDYVLPRLKLESTNVTINGSSYLQVTNVITLKKALNELLETGLFKQEINNIKGSSFFEFTGNQVNLTPSDGQQLRQRIEGLNLTSTSLNAALKDIVQETKENSIYIKFPEIVNFNDLSKASDAFNKYFRKAF